MQKSVVKVKHRFSFDKELRKTVKLVTKIPYFILKHLYDSNISNSMTDNKCQFYKYITLCGQAIFHVTIQFSGSMCVGCPKCTIF